MAIKHFPYTRYSLVPLITYRPHHGWVQKKFQNRRSQKVGERYFGISYSNFTSIM